MTSYRGLEIVERIKVSGSKWVICRLENGDYTCNCPSWIFHKGEKVNCKHINNYIKQIELTFTELKDDEADEEISEKEVLIDNYLSESYDRLRDQEAEQQYQDYMEKHKYDKE